MAEEKTFLPLYTLYSIWSPIRKDTYLFKYTRNMFHSTLLFIAVMNENNNILSNIYILIYRKSLGKLLMAKYYEHFCPIFQCKKSRYSQRGRVKIVFLNSFIILRGK